MSRQRSNRGSQTALFAPELPAVPKRSTKQPRELRIIVTVKAAPTPSTTYGETVCVAGVATELGSQGWIRLYPINFRYLEQDRKFKKYDVITVNVIATNKDARAESWRPVMSTLRVVQQLSTWKYRRRWVDPYIEGSMCALYQEAKRIVHARSLGLIAVRDVGDLEVKRHPGWTREEQRKIDAYVNQVDLFGEEDLTPLEAPRFRGFYNWRCEDPTCKGHRQGIIDWEFVALQRRFQGLTDAEAISRIRDKFLGELCAPGKDLAFYVGNQAKREHTFSVLGVYYPPATG